MIPCAGVGFRIGHAETHGPDAFRPVASRHEEGVFRSLHTSAAASDLTPSYRLAGRCLPQPRR